MAIGSVQSVVVCVPVVNASVVDPACPSVGSQMYEAQRVSAYLVNPSQGAAIDAALAPFDYGYASAVWALAFSMVVGLYVVSHGIGTVLGFLRRG